PASSGGSPTAPGPPTSTGSPATPAAPRAPPTTSTSTRRSCGSRPEAGRLRVSQMRHQDNVSAGAPLLSKPLTRPGDASKQEGGRWQDRLRNEVQQGRGAVC